MSSKKIKIAIFPPKSNRNTVIGSNGVALDSICIKCIEDEECSITGDYTLDATFLLDKETKLHENIIDEAILKVRSDDRYEIFRIVKIDKSTRNIIVVAKQITITEQKQLWLDDVRPTDVNGFGALQHIYNNAIGVKEINIFSNILLTNTAYYQTMNMYEACYDCDQSFANRWGVNGLETQRRGYNLYLNSKIGGRSNLSVREAKNVTGFNVNTNADTFVTRAIGKGFNGTKGHYIESGKKDNYARVNTKVFEYPDVAISTDEKVTEWKTIEAAQAELDRRVKLEFSENHVDEIKATYNINFVQLEKTEEYKNYSYLERADIGDEVKVYIPSLDIDVVVRVVRKKYNNLTQATEEITLSNAVIQTTISTNKIIADLKKQYLETGNTNIGEYIAAILNAGMKDSNVIIRENEILVMDTKDINTAKNVWRWNGGALAHSSEGYYSKNWNIGITQNGEINASLITSGILRAILIQSKDGGLQIDLSNTSNGIQLSRDGSKSINIKGSTINFFDWQGTTRDMPVGKIYSTRTDYDPNKCGICVGNNENSSLSLTYQKGVGEFSYPYIDFDFNNILGRELGDIYPMTIYKPFLVYGRPLFKDGLKSSQISLEDSDIAHRGIFFPNEQYIATHENSKGIRMEIKDKALVIYNDGQWSLQLLEAANQSAYRAQIWYSTLINGNLKANGNIACSGQKTRIVKTKSYGNVKLNAYESAECLFSDYGSGKINNDGECICFIDPKLLATINTNIKYQVFLTPYDYEDKFENIQLKIVKKEFNYFIVKSNCIGLEFDWNLVAKQKDYEALRLNDFDMENNLSIVERSSELTNDDYLQNKLLEYEKEFQSAEITLNEQIFIK